MGVAAAEMADEADVLRVSCDKCGRGGYYRVALNSRDATIVDWLDKIVERFVEVRKPILAYTSV